MAHAAGPRGMVLGQALDIAAETADRPLTLAEITELQAAKTGALIRWSAEAGAVLAGADTAPLTAYADAIAAIAKACDKGSVQMNPGISIKLSALHPRYEVAQEDRVMAELVPVDRDLARRARAANMGLNIDAPQS